MRAGAPVIATAHGGSPEILQAGKFGVLIPPGDAFALAGAIRRLMADPALRMRMGEMGRRRVQEVFSAERSLERLDEVLTGLLRDDPRSAGEAVRLR